MHDKTVRGRFSGIITTISNMTEDDLAFILKIAPERLARLWQIDIIEANAFNERFKIERTRRELGL